MNNETWIRKANAARARMQEPSPGNVLHMIWFEERWLTYHNCAHDAAAHPSAAWRQGAMQALNVATEPHQSATYAAHWAPIPSEQIHRLVYDAVPKIRTLAGQAEGFKKGLNTIADELEKFPILGGSDGH
jgi:hypothetical protein